MKNEDTNSDERGSGLDRRQLLAAGLGALALANSAQARIRVFAPAGGEAGDAQPRTLVLVQLSGGNDALSMVVPWADDGYNKVRDAIRIGAKEVQKLDDYRGLHPELKQLRKLWDKRHMAIVEGCSYPTPNRSHFKSMEIWQTASLSGRTGGDGWIGRMCDAAFPEGAAPELIVHVGGAAPYSVFSRTHPAIVFQTPYSYKWVAPEDEDRELYKESGKDDMGGESKGQKRVLEHLRGVLNDANESSLRIRRAAAEYDPRVEYPAEDFAQTLKVAAALIDARIGTRVISVELGGFDTHNNQRPAHDACMRRLDAGLGAFLNDIIGTQAGRDVIVVCFSEFGRRVKENGSRGTDHGVAAPMLVFGEQVKGGLYGEHPSLTDLMDGDLRMTTDFSSVYGTVIEKWFKAEQEKVLDAQYPTLGFVEA
ncbi:MAG: DUF1501 domain-containing protein [Planctomycetes bacterium]|nr:DUF1501 domain-containing protein [Planctomycetota bacterium]